jgi:hypothetical protein
VVIEAKLKSIPTQQQLDGYDAKLIKGIDFELDDVDPENDTENDVDPGIGYEQDNEQKWKVMRLKLFSDGGVGKCNPKCTIQARSDKSQVEKGLLKKFTGTVRRILLRPMGTSTVDSPKIGCWEQMNWQDIVEALNYNREDDACKNQLESVELRTCEDTDLLLRIISDYRDSLKQLLLILRKTFDYVKLSTDQKSTVTYQKYYEAITATKFKSSRIHDLVGKYASHIFEQHILEIISGTLANAVGNSANCVDCSSTKISQQPTTSFYICGFEFTLNSYTHFSNQQPGLGFEWIAKKQVGKEKKERKILFGVQIQGNHYRHYISADGGEPAQRKDVLSSLATMLTTNTSIPIDWFLDNSIFKLPNSPSFIKKESKKKKNLKTATFYAFGQDKFLYSKADISSVQISYLAQIVCRSLCSARQIISSQHNIICNSIKTFFPEPLQTDL